MVKRSVPDRDTSSDVRVRRPAKDQRILRTTGAYRYAEGGDK